MRLMNTKSLVLETFDARRPPPYAILSHTWEEDEVLFQDLQTSRWSRKRGASKVLNSCKVACRQKMEYIWIDTCCIDKTNPAELSEAINSMFRWYSSAHICYAYLSDFPFGGGDSTDDDFKAFGSARWFRRGWTLQELIAPPKMEFYSMDWKPFGTRFGMSSVIAGLTGIDENIITGKFHLRSQPYVLANFLRNFSVAQRMNWAANRSTTREEDAAYSLMGLFGIHMPLLYGEGQDNAMRRLQEGIIQKSGDQSILVHTWPSLLANNVNQFTRGILQMGRQPETELSFEQGGLAMEILQCPVRLQPERNTEPILAILNCCLRDDVLTRAALLLELSTADPKRYKLVEDSRKSVYKIGPKGCSPMWLGASLNMLVDDKDVRSARKVRIIVEMITEDTMADDFYRIEIPVSLEIIPRVEQTFEISLIQPMISDGLILLGYHSSSVLSESRRSLGYLILEDQHSNGVLLIWGYERHVGTRHEDTASWSPWCRMTSLTQLYEFGYHESLGTKNSWVSKAYNRSKFTSADPVWAAFCIGGQPKATMKVTTEHSLTAQIESESFVGRTVFYLLIDMKD